jgi:hypothetical protein
MKLLEILGYAAYVIVGAVAVLAWLAMVVGPIAELF